MLPRPLRESDNRRGQFLAAPRLDQTTVADATEAVLGIPWSRDVREVEAVRVDVAVTGRRRAPLGVSMGVRPKAIRWTLTVRQPTPIVRAPPGRLCQTGDRKPDWEAVMKGVTRFTGLSLLALALLLVLALASVASAQQRTANEQLLNDGSGSSRLAPTSTTVLKDRFDPASASFAHGSHRRAVHRREVPHRRPALGQDRLAAHDAAQRGQVGRVQPARQRHRLQPHGGLPVWRSEGQGRYLNVRVMIPRRSTGTVDSSSGTTAAADTQLLTFSPVVEPELLLSRGWAVAEVSSTAWCRPSRTPTRSDDSYWKSVDEMYQADPAYYWAYAAHPDWWSNPNGVAISDGATLRNLAGLVKNLLYREACRSPRYTYWLGWSMGGGAGTAVNTGRDRDGNYTGGDFVVPYEKSSGKVFDGFIALEPVYYATAPVDKQFPAAAPVLVHRRRR